MKKTTAPPQRQASLETANEMFKAAFAVKKTKLGKKNPELSEAELNAQTAQYFRRIAESEK